MTSTCMLLTASLLTVVLPFSGPVSPPSAPDHQSAVRGPFSVELPVAGLKPEHQPELEKVLGRAFGRDILELKCAPGRLSFYFGGKGPKSLLRLSDLKAALSQTGLKLDRRSWILMEQEVGLYVSAAEGIGDGALKKLLEGIGDAQVEVLGMLLDGSRAWNSTASSPSTGWKRRWEAGPSPSRISPGDTGSTAGASPARATTATVIGSARA